MIPDDHPRRKIVRINTQEMIRIPRTGDLPVSSVQGQEETLFFRNKQALLRIGRYRKTTAAKNVRLFGIRRNKKKIYIYRVIYKICR